MGHKPERGVKKFLIVMADMSVWSEHSINPQPDDLFINDLQKRVFSKAKSRVLNEIDGMAVWHFYSDPTPGNGKVLGIVFKVA